MWHNMHGKAVKPLNISAMIHWGLFIGRSCSGVLLENPLRLARVPWPCSDPSWPELVDSSLCPFPAQLEPAKKELETHKI